MTDFFQPVPGGSVGRTDQGVDISASPGSPVYAIGTSRVIGTIPNWYSGQPFYWFQLLSGPRAGSYWYAAEQISFSVSPGQIVQGGQQIGVIAPSGTGTEWGWATASGETLARATTGYTEGQQTQAGQDFMNVVLSGATPGRRAPGFVRNPISRPGGAGAAAPGVAVDQILAQYQQEIDLPRTAPSDKFVSFGKAGWTAPFQWWYQSFTNKWKAENPGG